MATEKRLIDKDALIERCDAPHWCVWMSEIEDFPTVDAVEVVRCKDCKNYDDKGYCWFWDYETGMSPNEVDADDFCSYGERKDNDCT